MTMPVQKPGYSRQDYGTPRALLDAVRGRLGIEDFAIDLAADRLNAVCASFIDYDVNSFTCDWGKSTGYDVTKDRWGWLNPPFGAIGPWVQKAWEESLRGAQVAMLVPASVGSNWWTSWVHRKARVLFLNGRVTFVGQVDSYPKDCAVLLYGRAIEPGYFPWRWMMDVNEFGVRR